MNITKNAKIIIHRLSRWFFIYRLKGSATSRV